jgi:hypothetical protein
MEKEVREMRERVGKKKEGNYFLVEDEDLGEDRGGCPTVSTVSSEIALFVSTQHITR